MGNGQLTYNVSGDVHLSPHDAHWQARGSELSEEEETDVMLPVDVVVVGEVVVGESDGLPTESAIVM